MRERQDTWVGTIYYNVDLFDEATMVRLALHYETLIAGLLSEPERGVVEVSLAGLPERQPRVSMIDGAAAPQLPPVRIPPRTVLERELAAMWGDLFGLEQVGVHDNFFDLGGHSLLAVRLVWALQEKLDVKTPVAAVFAAPTIAQLAELLSRDGTSGFASEAPCPAGGAGESTPLFFIPSIRGYGRLPDIVAGRLKEEFPYFDGLQYPGLGADGKPLQRVEEIAGTLVEQIRRVSPMGPYRLAGHSFGGVIAFEIARQLEMQGAVVDLLLLWDSFAPSGVVNHHRSALEVLAAFRHRLSALELAARPRFLYEVGTRTVRAAGRWAARLGQPSAPPAPLETFSRDEPLEQVRKASVEAYHQYRPGVYHGRAVLLRASDQPQYSGLRREIRHDPLNGWGTLVLGGLEVHEIPGDHMALVEEPAASLVAEVTLKCLRGCHAERASAALA
jgi:thioesterase domain-containing protein/acyl carrier protein